MNILKDNRVRIFLFAIFVVLSLWLTTTHCYAADTVASGECGADGDNVTWVLDSDGVLTISGTGAMRGYSFNPPWYKSGSSITSVIVEEGVTTIGNRAFYSLYQCTSVNLPNGIISIGSNAFEKCTALTSIVIPESVTSIDDYAFNYCNNRADITFECNVNEDKVGGILRGCPARNISFSKNDYTVEDGVVYNANKETLLHVPSDVTTFDIPNSVTSIGKYAFSSRDSLISVTIPNSVTSIGDGAFSGCMALTSITIPDSVTSIGSYAFGHCDSLTSVTIPDSVTSLGSRLFNYCNNRADITFECNVNEDNVGLVLLCCQARDISFSKNNYVVEDGAIYTVNKEILLHVPSDATTFDIPNSVISIGEHAFDDCDVLISVTIPNSVTSIDDCAFSGCSSLTSIIIPNSVTSIGWFAFNYCNSLTSVTIECKSSLADFAYLSSAAFPETANVVYEPHVIDNPIIVDSTCTVGGTKSGHCSICNKDVVATLPLAEHVYNEEHNCVACGKNEYITEYVISDTLSIKYDNRTKTLYTEGTGEIPKQSCKKSPWHEYATECTSIIVNEGVTKIGYEAFCDFRNVTDIQVASTVTYIDSYAFEYNTIATMNVYCKESSSDFSEFSTSGFKIPTVNYISHNYVESHKDPTCSEEGYDGTACSKCGSVGTAVTIPKLAHTDNGNGVCSVCGTSLNIASGTIGSINWVITKNGILNITGTGAIPDYSSGGAPWYSYRSSIVECNVGEGITTIGKYALAGLTSMTKLHLPQTLTTIKDYGINNTGLSEVRIPKNVKVIGKYGCKGSGTAICECKSSKSEFTSLGTSWCGFLKSGTYVGHNSDGITHRDEPTCVVAGSAYNLCTYCSDHLNASTIDALGHAYNGAESSLPTSNKKGDVGTYTCDRCGDTQHDEVYVINEDKSLAPIVSGEIPKESDIICSDYKTNSLFYYFSSLCKKVEVIANKLKVLQYNSDASSVIKTSPEFSMSTIDIVSNAGKNVQCYVLDVNDVVPSKNVKTVALSNNGVDGYCYIASDNTEFDLKDVKFKDDVSASSIETLDCSSKDINFDSRLDLRDAAAIQGMYNNTGGNLKSWILSDINNDRVVDIEDVALLLVDIRNSLLQ